MDDIKWVQKKCSPPPNTEMKNKKHSWKEIFLFQKHDLFREYMFFQECKLNQLPIERDQWTSPSDPEESSFSILECRRRHSVCLSQSLLLLMDKILHHLGWLKPYKQWDNYHPWWCRILSIHSSFCISGGAGYLPYHETIPQFFV